MYSSTDIARRARGRPALAVDMRDLPAGGPRRVAFVLDGSARAETAIPAVLELPAESATDCILIRAIRLPLHATTLGVLRQEVAPPGWRADVLALATRERSETQRTVLGSVADELVRRSPLPVLVCQAAPAAQSATLTGGS